MNKKQELRKFLINFFKLKKNFKGSISVESIENWDSLSHLELIIALEKKFKVKVKKISHELTSEDKISKLI